jgi:mannan endo-1,4-beta-mannosidase
MVSSWTPGKGMELYVDHISPGASSHDVFYNDPKMIASYRRVFFSCETTHTHVLSTSERYVKTIVNRYKGSPAIFAWEMMVCIFSP